MSYNIHILYIMYMYIISEFIIYVCICIYPQACWNMCLSLSPLLRHFCWPCGFSATAWPGRGRSRMHHPCSVTTRPWWMTAGGNASWTRNSGKWGGDIRTLFRNGRNGRGNGTNWFCQKVTVWVKGETTFGCLETEEGFTLMNYLFDFSLFLPTMDNSNFFFNQEKGFLEMYGNVTMKQCA